MDYNQAWQIVQKHVRDRGLQRHMQAVAAAMRGYAAKLGGDAEQWAITGLLHDYDWEIHPTLEAHPKEGMELLRQRGCDEAVVQAIASHNTPGTGVPRSTPMDFALLACDEITGLIIAVSLVRPSKNIADVELKSIKKKWKDKSFAAGVDRDHVQEAVADFSRECFDGSLDLWQHTEIVLHSMQAAAAELDLDGRLAAGAA